MSLKSLLSIALALAIVSPVGSQGPSPPAAVAVKATAKAPAKAKPKPKADPISVEVELDGPSEAQGGFAVVVTAPAAAVKRWRNQVPPTAGPALELTDNAGRVVLVYLNPPAGVYRFYLSAQIPVAGLDPFAEAEHVVTVGPVVPPEPPKPPDPPTPPKPTFGKRHLVLIRETNDDSVETGALVVQLQNPSGDAAQYFKSKGHRLTLLDDDGKDEDGAQSELIKKLAADLSGMALPVLMELDLDTDAVLYKQELKQATAADVVARVKEHDAQ